jgi:hypothetical protein
MTTGRPFQNTPESMKALAVIDSTTGCWLWPRAKDRDGYGRYVYHGVDQFVHRLSYQFWVAPLEPRMVIMHSCDIPSCYNPEHLKQGTQKENNADCAKKGRKPKGEKNGNSKLTAYQVSKIRQWSYFDKVSNEELSKLFNVSRRQIYKIINGVNWKE